MNERENMAADGNSMKVRTIGFLAFDGMAALDLVGPSEAFAAAREGDDIDSPPAYRVVVLGVDGGSVTCESGVRLEPSRGIHGRAHLDTVIVPGGIGLRRPETNARVADWLRRRTGGFRRVASVCTGIYGLAASGLLDGRRVTTHWRFARDVARRFPAITVDPDALFVKDGPYYTSAGVTAGIDLALAMIEDDLGARSALAVARELVVYLKRPGGQEQFSEPLKFQFEAGDALGDLVAWMRGHLRADLSVEALAARTCLCSRQFSRRFRSTFDRTPAAFVEDLRLGEARERLANGGASVANVAASVGFRSDDAFRRAFERRFGVSPTAYRGRFAGA
ncbi:MAG: GlxA family transcriptional regulator [Thermoanaerobaculia bacterium]